MGNDSNKTPTDSGMPLRKQGGSGRRRGKFGSGINSVDSVLPAVLSKLGLENRLREHALLQFWTGLLPQSLAQRCKPLFIDRQRQLVVAVSDASAAQELSLLKGKIMMSLTDTARSLGFVLDGLRIDMKSFHIINRQEVENTMESPSRDSELDLSSVELSADDKQLIVDLSHRLSESSSNNGELNSKALKSFEAQLRLMTWRKQQGYPLCSRCRNPVARLHDCGNDKLCFNCKLERESDRQLT